MLKFNAYWSGNSMCSYFQNTICKIQKILIIAIMLMLVFDQSSQCDPYALFTYTKALR